MIKSNLSNNSMAIKMLCIFILLNIAFVADIRGAVKNFTKPTGSDNAFEIDIPDNGTPSDIDPNSTDISEPSEPEANSSPSSEPEEAQEPIETEEPLETQDPVEPQNPVETDEPGQAVESDDPTEPSPSSDPVQTDEPLDEAEEVVSQIELDKIYRAGGEKVAYLTFDDGPTPAITNAILDILADENVKATFFVIGNQAAEHPEIIRRQYEEGHGIGNHSYTHSYNKIYKNVDSFLDELYRVEELLKSILETEKSFKLVRFPGGSFGEKRKAFRERINEEGFVYIDWNCLNGDAETSKMQEPEKLIERFKSTVKNRNSLVVLMHDSKGKESTVQALPEIIAYLKSEGYRFALLPGSRGYDR